MVMCFLVQLLKNKQYHAKAIIQHTVELTMYSHPSNVGPKFSPFLFYCIIVYVKQITTGKKSLRSSTACTILVNTTVGLNAFSGAFAEKTEICHRNQPACTPQLYADLRTLITLFPRVTHGFIVELNSNWRRRGSENKSVVRSCCVSIEHAWLCCQKTTAVEWEWP